MACAKKQQCVCYAPIDTRQFTNPLSSDSPWSGEKPYTVIPDEPLLESIERLKKDGIDIKEALDTAEPEVTLGLPSFDIDPPDSLPIRLNEILTYTGAMQKTNQLLKHAIETIIFVLGGIAIAFGLMQIVTGTLVDILMVIILIAGAYALFKSVNAITFLSEKRSLHRNIVSTAYRASKAFSSIKHKNADTYLLTGLNDIDVKKDDVETLRKVFSREA